eukprot:Seg2393.3 transcript_id=Seg2393.3/GoldUCD/mRNA.D3Y31 product="Endoplasmic reticulum aminopeptidase 2" protein_id=Seg2393.3/GoldUCD/D3Y31
MVRKITVTKAGKDNSNDFLGLQLSRSLQSDKSYVISLEFNGDISTTDSKGFYRRSFKAADGKTRYMASTQFEPFYARRLFPCFDEPALKANFELKVTYDEKLKAITNMPLSKAIRLQNGKIEDHFQKTPKMSTYLVAFVINQMEESRTFSTRGIPIRASSTSLSLKAAEFANNMAKRSVEIIEKKLGVNYPLPKLDVVLVPGLSDRAGDGWGLITLPVFDVKSPSQKYKATKTIIQQVAKMWFEGLVGMKWWSDHWLAESLSIIIQNEVLKTLNPTWNTHSIFYMEYTMPMLKRGQSIMDTSTLSRKLNSTTGIIKSLNEENERKGAAMLNMLLSVTGYKSLHKGIQVYLKRYTLKSASVEDFWASMPKAYKVPAMMKTWTNQPGYPVVHIKYDQRKQKIYATQSKFFTSKATHKGHAKWYIPLRFKTPVNKHVKRVILKSSKVSFHLSSKFAWFKANIGQTGLYRVNYDQGLWSRLSHALLKNHKVFGERDRAGLIDDAFTFARAGKLSYKTALSFTAYLNKEKSYLVWKIALEHFTNLVEMLVGKKGHYCVKKYLFGRMVHMIKQVGWTGDGTVLKRKARPDILKFAVLVGDKKVISEAKKMFKKWMQTKGSYKIADSLRPLVLKTGIHFGGEKEWNFVQGLLKNKETRQSERKNLLAALGGSKSAKKIISLLEMSFNPKNNNRNDVLFLLQIVSPNPVFNVVRWKSIILYWDKIVKRYGHREDFGSILRNLLKGVADKATLIKARNFIQSKAVQSMEKSSNLALEVIKQNLHFLNKNMVEVQTWVRKKMRKRCR